MGNIVVYSIGCPRCNVLESKLIAKHIPFEKVEDVEQMKALGLKSVPWLSVSGQMMDFAAAVKWANDQEVRE